MTRVMSLTMLLLLLPIAAVAQTTQGPLVLERIHNPFVVAPDFKIADVDGDTGQFAGAFAGRLLDNTLFIGGGYYWLVNGDGGEEMRYGGVMVGWSMPAGRIIRFGARGLVGLGTATLATDLAPGGGTVRPHDRFRSVPGQNVRFLARDDFFVFEPQLNAAVGVIPHVGIEVGGGYRLTGAGDALDDRLNGATGSIAVALTW